MEKAFDGKMIRGKAPEDVALYFCSDKNSRKFHLFKLPFDNRFIIQPFIMQTESISLSTLENMFEIGNYGIRAYTCKRCRNNVWSERRYRYNAGDKESWKRINSMINLPTHLSHCVSPAGIRSRCKNILQNVCERIVGPGHVESTRGVRCWRAARRRTSSGVWQMSRVRGNAQLREGAVPRHLVWGREILHRHRSRLEVHHRRLRAESRRQNLRQQSLHEPHVNCAITYNKNRFWFPAARFRNNVKRIISGKLTLTGKGGEGRFSVKYDTFPLSYDASLVVLDTDYKNYAVR